MSFGAVSFGHFNTMHSTVPFEGTSNLNRIKNNSFRTSSFYDLLIFMINVYIRCIRLYDVMHPNRRLE